MEESIEQYKSQLKQVEDALRIATDTQEIESLQSLKSDLEELIDLTKQTISQETDDSESNSNAALNFGNSSSNSFDDEMALFMSEIRSLGSTADAAMAPECDTDEKFASKLQAIKDELQGMIGKKCSAPHEHTWGGRAYHNAIICGLDDTRDYDIADIKDFRLRILFTNPTHKEMVPCGYFLDGNCRFDVDRCRFSHGELVPFGELRDYKEPEFDKLSRNCIVLAKMSDKMWHKGRVLCANFVDKSCRVRLENKKKDEDFNFEDLFPVFHDDDDSSNDDSDSDDGERDGSDITDLRDAYLIEKALLTPSLDQALGEWEKHTRGIGSKLMQKMGYIIGNGLGSKGEGIIVPISAQILPPGRSLDHCMELREAANGDKDLFSVERKLETQKKKQEALNAKSYQRGKNNTDIFAFLNDNIFSPNAESKTDSKPSERNVYKNHSVKNLNVESLKIAEDIRRKEKEIQKLKESMRRHTSGSDVFNKMNAQLSMKHQELNSLKKSETSVAHEQQLRRHKDKMAVF